MFRIIEKINTAIIIVGGVFYHQMSTKKHSGQYHTNSIWDILHWIFNEPGNIVKRLETNI